MVKRYVMSADAKLELRCAMCDARFFGDRSTAKYCSDKCKVAAYRKRIGEAENAPEIRLAIDFNETLSGMRIRVRPLDIEVEYAARDGRYEQKQKQWFLFSDYPALEDLFNDGVWSMTLIFKLAGWYKPDNS